MWKYGGLAKTFDSNVPGISELVLTIAILPATVPVITELSTNRNKYTRHSVTFKNQQ